MKKLNRPVRTTPSVSKQNMEPKNNSFLGQSNMNNSSLISNMKLQLSNIKIDVQKLMNQDSTIQCSFLPYKLQAQNQTLKRKLDKVQESYEKLRGQFEKYRQSQAKRVRQFKQLMDINKELQIQLVQIEVLKSNIQIQKLKLQTEYHRVDGIKSKLQKEQVLQQQFHNKISEQKLRIQNQNLKLQAQLKKEKQKNNQIQAKQNNKIKQQYECIKVQLKKSREQIIQCQQLIQIKEKQIKCIEDSMLQKQNIIFQQKNKQMQSKLEEQLIRFQVQLNDKQKQILRGITRIQQQQINISRLETQITILNKQKQGLEGVITNIQTSKINITSETDELLLNNQEQIKQLKDKLKTYQIQINNLIAKCKQYETNNVSIQTKYSSILNQKNKQILKLKAEVQSARKLQVLVSSSQMQIGSKNHFEMELQNKIKQIQILKMKMDALNKKVEVKSLELKQKDQFITNVLVNKVKRESNQTEIQYFKNQISKYFSITLHDKLIESEKEIIKLKEEIYTFKAN